LLVEHQKLRRGNAALARPAVDLLASIVKGRDCTVAGGKIKGGQLSYGSPSNVLEGDEGFQALRCCDTLNILSPGGSKCTRLVSSGLHSTTTLPMMIELDQAIHFSGFIVATQDAAFESRVVSNIMR